MKKITDDLKVWRLTSKHCIVAADVDKTLLEQTKDKDEELKTFKSEIGPALVEAAQNGVNVAFLTGNSMEELIRRILRYLIDELIHRDELEILDRFHFFCNSGGVYARFDVQDSALAKLIANKKALRGNSAVDKVIKALTIPGKKTITIKGKKVKERLIHPRFIDTNHVRRSAFSDEEIRRITTILEEEAATYFQDLHYKEQELDVLYNLDLVRTEDNSVFTKPAVDQRLMTIIRDKTNKQVSVQVTLKPILSFRHLRDESKAVDVIGRDLRSELIAKIQRRFVIEGLRHYTARPGGRTSIDVTPDWLDKAFALEYLITELNARGVERDGQKIGSNTLYIGDEVIVGGGNDYPVARLPGILVIAVNVEQNLIPFNSKVFAASKFFEGPNASAEMLKRFNMATKETAERIVKSTQPMVNGRPINSVEFFKRTIFIPRILDRIKKSTAEGVSVDDIQIIHAIATLLGRRDPTARKWMTVIEKELNEFMEQFSLNDTAIPPALGASSDDWLH